MQTRYKYGTLTRRKRKRGPDVWQWRWMDGGRQKSDIMGTVEELPDAHAVWRAVDAYRLKLNSEKSPNQSKAVTVGMIADLFITKEIPKHCRHSTRASYLTCLNRYLKPRWGTMPLKSVQPMAVEDWLESLCKLKGHAQPLAPKSKTHIRNLFHLLFQCAMRWELADRNPIALVRQSSKRLHAPRVLKPGEFVALIRELADPYKTMVLVSGGLGLRASEVMGLQWGDFDWENLTVMISRGVVHGRMAETKTEASQKAMPIDASLKDVLEKLRQKADYKTDADYVFAGEGGKPRWQESILADHLKPAGVRAGIGKIGWHTFRHTYATLLHSLGAPLAIQKELLRHADIQTTMNIYTQAVSESKREAAIKTFQFLTTPKAKEAESIGLLQ